MWLQSEEGVMKITKRIRSLGDKRKIALLLMERRATGIEDKQDPCFARLSLICLKIFIWCKFYHGSLWNIPKNEGTVVYSFGFYRVNISFYLAPILRNSAQLSLSDPQLVTVTLRVSTVLIPKAILKFASFELYEQGIIEYACFVSDFLLFNMLFVGFVRVVIVCSFSLLCCVVWICHNLLILWLMGILMSSFWLSWMWLSWAMPWIFLDMFLLFSFSFMSQVRWHSPGNPPLTSPRKLSWPSVCPPWHSIALHEDRNVQKWYFSS